MTIGLVNSLIRSRMNEGGTFMHDNPTKFVVLSRGRTASTFLMNGISCHPDIRSLLEIFHPNNPVEVNGQRYEDCDDSWEFIQKNLFERTDLKEPIRGFKLFYFHAQTTEKAKAIWRAITERDDIKLISLERKNTFASFISEQRAKKKKLWHPSRNPNDYASRELIKIDLKFLEQVMDNAATQFRYGAELVKRKNGLSINYEDLRDDSRATFEQTIDYLGAKQGNFKFPEFLGTSEGAEFTEIENIDEVRHVLERRGDGWMLDSYL